MEKTMQIGLSQVKAPVFTLGTFGIGGGTSWQDTTDDDGELIEMIRQAYDLGIWGLDTAPVYGTGRSERIIGQAIKGRREKYYISTKCALNWRSADGIFTYMRDGKAVYNNFDGPELIRDCEESLQRLNTEYIDLMIIHRCPPLDRFGEVMEAMEKLKNRQLIRAVGLANVIRTGHPLEALDTCRKYGELDLLQESGSLLNQDGMQELIRYCEEHHVTYQAHSVLEKGILTGKIPAGAINWAGDNRSQYKWFQPERIPKVNALLEGLQPLARKNDCSVAVLCLAWLLAQGRNMNLLVGTRKLQHLQDSLRALEIVLDPADVLKMNALAEEAVYGQGLADME